MLKITIFPQIKGTVRVDDTLIIYANVISVCQNQKTNKSHWFLDVGESGIPYGQFQCNIAGVYLTLPSGGEFQLDIEFRNSGKVQMLFVGDVTLTKIQVEKVSGYPDPERERYGDPIPD